MKSSDHQLRQMFVRATDEVIRPAPWLESKVVDAIQLRKSARFGAIARDAFAGFGSGIRLAAGLMALAIAIGAIAALLMGTRLIRSPIQPGGKSSVVQTPSQSQIIAFAPSPPVRASNWPPGGPVPGQMAGAWQRTSSDPVLHLGAYTFQLGEEHRDPGNNASINPALFGNVLVNGSEIDFMSDTCTAAGEFGYERFTYVLSGNTLVLTRAQGQTNCWGDQTQSLWPPLAGTYTRVSAP